MYMKIHFHIMSKNNLMLGLQSLIPKKHIYIKIFLSPTEKLSTPPPYPSFLTITLFTVKDCQMIKKWDDHFPGKQSSKS